MYINPQKSVHSAPKSEIQNFPPLQCTEGVKIQNVLGNNGRQS